MVLFGELGEAEMMVVWVAEILFRENLPLVLHALRIVDQFTDLTCFHFDSFALLRYDILVDALVNLYVLACQRVLPAIALLGLPVIHSAHHLIIRRRKVLVIVRSRWGSTSRVQTLLVMLDHRHRVGAIHASCL